MLEATTRPGMVLGIDQDLSGNPLTARIGEAGLATLAIGGGTVTLGLIRPWGEIWPRWVPFLAGRRVPVALGLAPEPAEPPAYTGWATWAPGWLWPFLGNRRRNHRLLPLSARPGPGCCRTSSRAGAPC